MKDVMEWCQYYVTLPHHGAMSSVNIMHYVTVLCIYFYEINEEVYIFVPYNQQQLSK
jgi:tRNA C32,U32 (ribose-2'-O)-methylase TrmJ